MKNYSIKTDLAIEVAETLTKHVDVIDGVEVNTTDYNNIILTWVKINTPEGEQNMGKPIGNYVTIESNSIKENDVDTHEEITNIFSECLSKICKLEKDTKILVVGLGNQNVTPDALGPKVVSKILVTRHIKDSLPNNISDGVRPVSAISPGVMGTTGMETAEIIKGIVDRVSPDLVIAVDALATRKTSRINATIQMSDTGVSPGAGMGNKRKTINQQYLGVPVIAIGVPTVVDAGTLVNDTIDLMIDSFINEMKNEVEDEPTFYEIFKNLDKEQKYDIISNILNSEMGNLFVTPKEVDEVVERLSKIIANSINIAMHPSIDFDDMNRYI